MFFICVCILVLLCSLLSITYQPYASFLKWKGALCSLVKCPSLRYHAPARGYYTQSHYTNTEMPDVDTEPPGPNLNSSDGWILYEKQAVLFLFFLCLDADSNVCWQNVRYWKQVLKLAQELYISSQLSSAQHASCSAYEYINTKKSNIFLNRARHEIYPTNKQHDWQFITFRRINFYAQLSMMEVV